VAGAGSEMKKKRRKKRKKRKKKKELQIYRSLLLFG
jgi:hypothetical protein